MTVRAKAIHGVKWLTVSMVATTALGFAQTMILSHLLDRRDFGLSAMAWVVLGFAQNFADVGISNALVQKHDATSNELSSVYWLNLFMGLFLTIIIWGCGPLIAGFYHEPELTGLIPWLAASFTAVAIGQPFRMLAQRDMRFQAMALAEISAVLVGLVVAVIAAQMRQGAYSLAFAGLASASARSLLFIITGCARWHPVFHFRRKDLTHFVRFGLFQLGDRNANFVWSNVDYLIIGRTLGADALGVYRLAYELAIRPMQAINPIITTVAYPIFAKHQTDNGALRRGMLEVVRLISTLAFPLSLGLTAIAPSVVPLVFGQKWIAAVPLVQVFGVLGAIRALGNPVGTLLMTKGRVDLGFYWNVLLAIVHTIVFLLVVQRGVLAIAWAATIIAALQIVVSYRLFYSNTIQLPILDYLKAFGVPLALSVIMGLAVRALAPFISPLVGHLLVEVAVLVLVGGAIYLALSIAFARSYLLELKLALLSRRGG